MNGAVDISREQPLLRIEDVSLSFGGLLAVGNLSIDVRKGSINGLIGPNGAGKTTVFNIISGFYRPDSGRVLLDGRDITGRPPHRVCRAHLARTFQNIRLFQNETVLQNVMVGFYARQKSRWWQTMLAFPGAVGEERRLSSDALELLRRVGLDVHADAPASSLPYGAQRRLEIARALATRPQLLLLDEPAAGMNPQESEELLKFIRSLRDEFQLTVMLIEHDMKVVMGLCEHIWVLDMGRMIAEGTPAAIKSNPQVIEAYLGKEAVNAGN